MKPLVNSAVVEVKPVSVEEPSRKLKISPPALLASNLIMLSPASSIDITAAASLSNPKPTPLALSAPTLKARYRNC